MKETPIVTCVINVRNCEEYIERTIASVKAQTIPVRLLVIDNHSTDHTYSLVAQLPDLTLIKPPQPLTLGSARDLALSYVDTEYVSWLDADDLWDPTFCEESIAAFRRHEGVSVVSSGTILIDEFDQLLPLKKQRLMVKKPKNQLYAEGDTLPKMFFKLRSEASWQAYFFRTEDVRRVGGFSSKIDYATDFDLITKLVQIGSSIHIQKNLSKCRIHSKQLTAVMNPEPRFNEGFSIIAEAGKKSGLLDEKKLNALYTLVKFRISLALFQEKKGVAQGIRTAAYLCNPRVAIWFFRRVIGYNQY